MQIVGLILLTVVIAFGFTERQMTKVSAFDLHALVIVSGGSFAAIMVSSSVRTVWHTLLCLRELLPIPGPLEAGTARLEDARRRFVALWREGKRAQAVEVAERSGLPAIERMLELVLGRAGKETVDAAYLELRHAELGRWQPPTTNWELLARLGPSFGLVGTVTGIVVLFRNMGNDNLNIGAAMSLALVSTLYGIAFGAGIAGPMGHYLRGLVDERLGALARCQQSTVELIERGLGSRAWGAGPEMERRPPDTGEAWLLSYADLITNLLIFFLVLLSAATISESRMQTISKYLSGQESPHSLERIEEELRKQVREHGLEMLIATDKTDEGLEVSLNSGLVFDTGDAAIRPEQVQAVDTMLETLVPYAEKYRFAVEGHTDSQPIAPGGRYASNWELSTARANAVRHRLQLLGVAPARVRVEGYADTKPLPEGKLEGLSEAERLARHRRVVVRIY